MEVMVYIYPSICLSIHVCGGAMECCFLCTDEGVEKAKNATAVLFGDKNALSLLTGELIQAEGLLDVHLHEIATRFNRLSVAVLCSVVVALLCPVAVAVLCSVAVAVCSVVVAVLCSVAGTVLCSVAVAVLCSLL
jgi:hypothetical protein